MNEAIDFGERTAGFRPARGCARFSAFRVLGEMVKPASKTQAIKLDSGVTGVAPQDEVEEEAPGRGRREKKSAKRPTDFETQNGSQIGSRLAAAMLRGVDKASREALEIP